MTDAFGQDDKTTLPTGHDGPWYEMSKPGWKQEGLEEDFGFDLNGSTDGTSANFDSAEDYILVSFETKPGILPNELSYQINLQNDWMNLELSGEFVVQESADGVNFSNLKTFGPNGTTLTNIEGGMNFIHKLSAGTRYVRFKYNDAGLDFQSVQLDAIRLTELAGPEIEITQGNTNYTSNISAYVFPTQNQNTLSSAVTFKIKNNGTADLVLTNNPFINIIPGSNTQAKEFQVDISQLSSIIAAGGESVFTVTFAPVTFGSKAATLIIVNNDSDEGNFSIKLEGNAKIFAPANITINPTAGMIGSTVIINGSNLWNTSEVAFNGPLDGNGNPTLVQASWSRVSDNEVTAIVPANATTGRIRVSTAAGFAESSTFTVNPQPAPTITGFNPAQGKVGTSVTITGTNFKGATVVQFGSVGASINVNTDGTEITTTVPSNASTGKIFIKTPGGEVTSTTDFEVLQNPVISSISPNNGPVGSTVTIYGSNFVNGNTTVYFYKDALNSVKATSITFVDAGEIKAVVPAGAVTGPIKVETKNGTTVIGTSNNSETFTVSVLAPSISYIALTTTGPPVTSAKPGERIFINGQNLKNPSLITFNGVAATSFGNATQDGTKITAVVPATASTGPLKVTVSGITTTYDNFIITVPAPTIKSFSPASGKVGEQVVLTGTNYTANTIVTFNNTPATSLIVNSSTQITVLVPEGATSGFIRVANSGSNTNNSSATPFEVIIPNTTYTWNVGSGNWTDPNSWDPVRNSPTTADILIFDGSKTSSPFVDIDYVNSQTIGQIRFTNSVKATLKVANDKMLILDNSVAGTDFLITAGAAVNITNSVAGAKLEVVITNGETGTVAGELVLKGDAGSAAHKILAEGSDGLLFQNNGKFVTGINFSGNPFGTTNLNSVRFTGGATLINESGGSPFGAAEPNSVLIFDPGSYYQHTGNTAPDLNNRIYSNFEVSNAAFSQTVAGTGNLTVNNLTVTSANNFDINLSGTISIKGDITVTGGALNFNPAAANNINMSGNGTRIISGFGELFLGNNARLNVPLGIVVDLKKQISGFGNVIVDGSIKTNVVEGFAGGAATALNSGVTPTLNPGSIIEYYGLGVQTISPIKYANLTISGNRNGNTITLGAGTIKVSEAFTNPALNLSYAATDNTVEFNGGAQIIPVLPYNSLTASGSAGKSLAGNIQVNGNVNVIATTINTGANRIILNSAATISESQTSYVIGKVEATRNVTAGATQNFGGVGLTLAPTAGSLSPGNTTVVRSTGIGSIKLNEERQSIARVYDITAANSSDLNTAITLKYAPAELLAGQDEAKLSMYKKAGEDPWLEQVGNYVRTPVQRTITLSGVTGFSSWTLGEQATILPVELLEFTATRNGQTVQLNWATAMEKDNKGFEIQVSTDAKNFEVVSFVNSKNSNSTAIQKYNYVDNKTKPADVLYYRLRQVDFDGTETYSAVKAVTYNNEHIAITASAYPNPFDDSFTVVVNADAQKIASLTITDALGKKVMEKTVTLTKGSNDIKFNLGSQFPAGIYIINLTTNNFQQHLKMVKR
ncbi:hypothetical protein AAE02nite_36440 [Adhaeribacter aerolatus]|uniref:IPT/TIG domain-containing protein n=1 Tax=Adhaeribacter aerolatus TaxID=670289 RepID=A0A512B1Z8_9BACT|nr:hypothetical protein AAE02nite_36440 [Adhaeribacter aerolatus]